MTRFAEEWFQDVPTLVEKTDEAYAKLVAIGKPDKITVTKNKIYENRGWLGVKSLVEPNFDAVLRTLNIFYLPKAVWPGPAFVFPIRDLDGVWRQAQVRPFEDSWLWLPSQKYRRLGTAVPFLTGKATWCGNDDATLKNIIRYQSVILVEGPFDLLACRLLAPECPVMSPLRNAISEDHLDYLRILGVKEIVLMFDLDDPEGGGAGTRGEYATRKRIRDRFGATDMTVSHSDCSASDPSDALRARRSAGILQQTLEAFVKRQTLGIPDRRVI